MHRLRYIRAAVALVVFVPAALMFLDAGRFLPPKVAPLLAGAQLVPAILRRSLLVVLILVGLTLLLGRVYCSTVCPLGTLQDLLIRLGDRGHRRGRYRFRHLPPRRSLHLGLAALVTVAALFGVTSVLGLLEPYSLFGRVLSSLVQPLVLSSVNGISHILARWHIYALEPIPIPVVGFAAMGVALVSLLAVVVLSLRSGRRFCNLLCPAGALLRLASLSSVLRVSFDEARCNGCGVCEKACKAGCIDAEQRRVDVDACVSCFVCLDVCPRDGIGYGLRRRAPAAPAAEPCRKPADAGRRALLRAAALSPAMALLLPSRVGADADPRDARLPITPPGSRERRHFTDHCTACHLCVVACPTQVLRPSLLEYGAVGLLQPRLVYEGGSCVEECHRCGEVCPTGAIRQMPLPEKKLVQVGRARFVKADCVVETKKKACGACAEHCPTKAISMVPYPGGDPNLRIPEVNEEACIGCGACEHPCPVQPRKAIWVEARSPHGVAKPLKKEELKKPAATEEFPF